MECAVEEDGCLCCSGDWQYGCSLVFVFLRELFGSGKEGSDVRLLISTVKQSVVEERC